MPEKNFSKNFDCLDWSHLWDALTRKQIKIRLKERPARSFLNKKESEILKVLIYHILPEIPSAIPVTEILSAQLSDKKSGVRDLRLPWKREKYRLGLRLLNCQARKTFGTDFLKLGRYQQEQLLKNISQNMNLDKDLWQFPSDIFFNELVSDLAEIYYSFPQSWNQIKFPGPAYPTGYYRLSCDEKLDQEPELKKR